VKIGRPRNGIAPPPGKTRPGRHAYPLADMVAGQHFDVVLEDGDDPIKVYSRLYQAVRQHRKSWNPKARFRIATIKTENLLRCWRLEDKGSAELTK